MWRMPFNSHTLQLAYVVKHQHEYVACLAWAPNEHALPNAQHAGHCIWHDKARVGILAMSFGDGYACIAALPCMDTVAASDSCLQYQ